MTAAARRGHGEGSIRRKVTGRTKTEVREKLKRLRVEVDAGLKTSASYTLAKAVDDWAAEALAPPAPLRSAGGTAGARARSASAGPSPD
jgi:hypothetical protein